jgi:hypothetical protein
VTLFPTSQPKPKSRPIARERAECCIPTGAPRVVESSNDRISRATVETWQLLIDAVRRSTTARLSLLSGRSGAERVSCPWERIISCDSRCRCRGAGTVTVDFLRSHYASLANDIVALTRPALARRSS